MTLHADCMVRVAAERKWGQGRGLCFEQAGEGVGSGAIFQDETEWVRNRIGCGSERGRGEAIESSVLEVLRLQTC